jgi:hypothetical protein
MFLGMIPEVLPRPQTSSSRIARWAVFPAQQIPNTHSHVFGHKILIHSSSLSNDNASSASSRIARWALFPAPDFKYPLPCFWAYDSHTFFLAFEPFAADNISSASSRFARWVLFVAPDFSQVFLSGPDSA